MAFFKIENVKIEAISACVPKKNERNRDIKLMGQTEIDKFIETTGVENRRISNEKLCTSDLCFSAADSLLNKLNFDRSNIDIVIFVSQTSDYILPMTSAILQDRLGLTKECLAFDIPIGCSGYVYGLSVISSMMSAGNLKKGLLLVGDTISKLVSENDKSTFPLFGDAGSATCLSYDKSANPFYFNLGTDGSGKDSIIIRSGGSRNPIIKKEPEFKKEKIGFNERDFQLVLDGMDVFSFGINQAPKAVNSLLDYFKLDFLQIDYFIFHQANKMMNNMISKKLKLLSEKAPQSLKNFGNTSSASIPLTIISQINSQIFINNKIKMLMCGFGVGLSWGAMYLELDNIFCMELIEIE